MQSMPLDEAASVCQRMLDNIENENMNVNNSTSSPRSLIARASENGLYIGLYIIVLAVATALTPKFNICSALVWGGSIALPFFLYGLLRRSYAEKKFESTYLELWAEGTTSFAFAGMILAVVVYIGLRYIIPDFMADQVAFTIEAMRAQGTSEGAMWAEAMENMRDTVGIPTATDMASQAITLNIIVGSIITLIVGLILKSRYSDPSRRERYLKKISKG